MGENKKPTYLFDGMDPPEQAALIQDLWYNEAAQFHAAAGESGDLRIQALDHSDALLDAWLDLQREIGNTALSTG